jgi:hypothetical protein
MKRWPNTASVACLLLLSQPAAAAGRHDGEWIGSATSTGGWRCQPASVTLTVEGKFVTGQARFPIDSPSIHGTVMEDGTLGATIGFQHLTGKFVEDEFEGTFRNLDCVWKLMLKRKR